VVKTRIERQGKWKVPEGKGLKKKLKLLKAYKNTMSKKTYIMPTGAKKT
jgi:hypothetical protein